MQARSIQSGFYYVIVKKSDLKKSCLLYLHSNKIIIIFNFIVHYLRILILVISPLQYCFVSNGYIYSRFWWAHFIHIFFLYFIQIGTKLRLNNKIFAASSHISIGMFLSFRSHFFLFLSFICYHNYYLSNQRYNFKFFSNSVLFDITFFQAFVLILDLLYFL